MAKVIRGNVVLHVDDRDVEHYLTLGYNHIEEDGTVIKSSIPSDVGTLQVAYVEFQNRIAELESELAMLKSEKKTSTKSKKQ